jgi:L-alanine-DL-glutamate epimerase-like enolase superfamily enzyme
MKITRVRARTLWAPLKEPWRISTAVMEKMYATLVLLETDSGEVGVGECLTRLGPSVHCKIIEEILSPLLLDRDPFQVEKIWEEMYEIMRPRGHSKGFMVETISGVDIALWDLIGKSLGQPLHRILGSYSPATLPAYASSILLQGREAMVREAVDLVRSGFSALKVKIGRDWQKDLENITSIREAVGQEVSLMADANCAYDRRTALRVGRALEELGFCWFEEPLMPEDLEGYALLSRVLDLPIAAGESEFTRYGFRELITRGKIDIIQPDVCRAGGITECRRIAALASAYHLPCSLHTGASSAVSMAASLQVAASLPNFLTFEYMFAPNPLREEIVLEPFHLTSGGEVVVPTGPGLGIELRGEVWERFALC